MNRVLFQILGFMALIYNRFLTRIDLTQRSKKMLGHPYSKCTKQVNLYVNGTNNYNYSIHGCFDVCHAKSIINICNCSSRHWPMQGNDIRPCINPSEFNSQELDLRIFGVKKLHLCMIRNATVKRNVFTIHTPSENQKPRGPVM